MTPPVRPLFDPQGNPNRPEPRPLFDPTGNPIPLPPDIGPLTVSTDRARRSQPDTIAEAFAIARRMGIPAEVIAANIEQVRALEGDADFDPPTFAREAPETAAWLSDEMNAGVSKDDWANLGTIERLVGRDWRLVGIGPLTVPIPMRAALLAREAVRGTAGLRLSELSFNTTPNERAGMQTYLAELRAQAADNLPESTNLAERGLRGVFRYVLPSMSVVAEESAKGAAVGGLGGLGLGAVTGPAALATGAAGASLGAIAGAFKKSWELVGGEAIDAFSQVKDVNGELMDPMLADVAGRTFGLFGALPEVIGLGFIVRPFGRVASRALAQGTVRALAVPTTRAAVLNGVRAGATAFGAETTTEVLQTAIQLAGEQVARDIGGDTFEDIPFARVRDELLATAVETALSMAWVGGAAGITTTVGDYARVVESGNARDRMLAFGESAQASVLLQRSPEKFQELVKRQTEKGGAVRDVLMPVERFTLYWQSQNLDPAQVATDLGIGEQYLEAAETGGDVVMPLADYATKIAAHPTHGPAMVEDIRLRPGALTAREAKELDATIEQETTKLRGELETAKPENDSEQRLVDDVVAQLTVAASSMPAKTRYTPEQIATMAEGIARPYLSLARRSKQDAFALYQRKKLRIVGPNVAEGFFETQSALEKAVKRGRSTEEIAALRVRLHAMREGQVTLRDVLKAEAVKAKQTEGATDAQGRLTKALSTVTTDALVVEYIARRDRQVALDAEIAGFMEGANEDGATGLSVLELLNNGEVEDALGMADAGGKWGEDRLRRAREAFKERGALGKSVARLDAELQKRGVENADVYADERDLVGDDSFNFNDDVSYQLPMRREGFARGELKPGEERLIEHAVAMKNAQGGPQIAMGERLPWVSPDDYTAAFYDLLQKGEDVRKLDDPAHRPTVLRQDVTLPATIDVEAEDSAAYAQATEARDFRAARRILERVLGIKAVEAQGSERDGAGQHQPIGPGFGAQGHDLTALYPDDVYSNNGPRYYGSGDDALDRAAWNVAMEMREKPNATVTVYRAVPKDVKGSLREGDWVTTVRAYAKQHGESTLLGDYRIISKKVRAQDIFTDADSMLEWGYFPQGERFKKGISFTGPADARRPYTLEEMVTLYRKRPSFLRQGEEKRPNAFLALGVSQDTIGLMKTANLSSVLHEFAHDWLNLLADLATAPDATPELQAEWQVVMKELGITSRDQLGEQEQEHWARAFEKYLADGNAPTKELARMFSRFKAWMRAVYNAALANFAPVSPELRGVFDRMFVAEQATVEAMQETEPMFESAEEAGWTDAEFAAHQRAVADIKDRSEAALLATMLSESNTDRREGWKERNAVIEAEVRAEVEGRPVQAAVKFLRAKTTPKEGKPSKAMLIARYGPEVLATLPKGTYTADGGIDPDILAFSVGLDSGDTLVTQLQNWEADSLIITRETDRRMRSEFPDLVNDSPALADEARKQVHAAVNDDVILNELKALGRSDASTPAPNIKAVKQIAAEMIDKTAIRDLKPHAYLLAERKANKLAKESLRKGDIPRAAFHGRQQLLNHILYRYATKAVAMEQRALKFFSRMSTDGMRAKLGLAGPIYQDAMDAILNDYEFVRTSNIALDRRAKLNAWLTRMNEDGLPVEVPPSVLNDAALRNYRTLTAGELRSVYDTGKQIHTTATNKGKLIDAKRKRDAEAVEREMVKGIASHHELKPRVRDYAPERFKWAKTLGAKMDAWHVKPEFLFTWLDGEQSQGTVWRNLFQPIAESEAEESQMIREMLPNLKAIFDSIPKETRKGWLTRSVQVGTARLTGAEVFSLALNWGNDGNRVAVLNSEIDGNPEWSLADVEAALRTLTREEALAVQAAWDLVDSYWSAISAMQQRLVGLAPQKVEAVPFTLTLADGSTVEMRGGYYPLAYDREYSWSQEKIEQKKDVQELGEWGYTKAATRHGHTEARVGSGGKPVKLDVSVLGEHLLNVIHDLTHREAVINTQRLIERDGVRTAITQAAGAEMFSMLAPWLKRVAADRLPPASPVESFLGRARRGATVVNMGLKATTAIVQPLGYFQSIDFLGAKYAGKGMSAFLKSPKAVWEFASESSETIRGRRESFDREARDLLKREASGKKDWQSQIARASMFFTGMADMSVSVPTWYGAYLKEMDANGDHDKAVLAGDQAVRMTQGSGAAKDLARIQGGGEAQRIFTLFYSYFSVLYNQMRRSGKMVKGPSDVPKFLGSMAFLWFLPAILSELVAQRGPEDDDEWGEWAAWELARYPLASVIGVRDIASAVGPDAYDYNLSPVVDAFSALAETANNVGAATFGDEEMSRSDWKTLVEATGYWGQLPARQAWITGTYLYDWMMGYDTPDNPVEATRNLMFTRPRN